MQSSRIAFIQIHFYFDDYIRFARRVHNIGLDFIICVLFVEALTNCYNRLRTKADERVLYNVNDRIVTEFRLKMRTLYETFGTPSIVATNHFGRESKARR